MTRRTLSGTKAIWLVVPLLILLGACGAWGKTVHKIHQGDNLWDLAKKYHTTPAKLARANGIKETATLKLDRKLVIPGQRTASSSKARKHKLAVARTKSHKAAIAAKHHTSKSRLAAAKSAAKKTRVATAPRAGSAKLIRTALNYQGTRYRSGGTSRGGFDCSGFTRYIYAKYGIVLPHSSAAQARIGVPVSRGQLKPGDLVFFHTYKRGIGHVGIYIGGGRFVHSSTYGRGVTTDSLGSSYYAPRYRGARRVK